ncbi:MAG: TonB-dependent receptor [Candidatus Marinimicrobia bacterium]|nr:TonB-dependent receptor [Candidatus Neomarinimicrobiota bacterium]
MNNKNIFTVLTLLLIFIFSNAFTQTTGKISGRVIDKETGDPLIGTNIIIEGTQMGAAADSKGEFFIINASPGVYNVIARMIGYGIVRMENIRISVNSTTNLIFELSPEVIKGEEIIVTADAISIKKDQTSSVRIVSSEEINLLPVENVDMVVNMQAGVLNGHFRGGRNTEVTYLIDGINIDNSFSGNNKSIELEKEVVQELEVITGTFNAEYGHAMSGVVNVVTKDGGNKFHGSISSSIANFFTGNNDIFIGLGEDDHLTRNLSQDYKIQFDGPIYKDKLSFIVNYRYQELNSYLNGIRRFNPKDYSEYLSENPEDWHIEHTGDNKYVSMETAKYHNLFGKLTFKASRNFKIGSLFTLNDNVNTFYNHFWKYNPDVLINFFNKSFIGAFTINHMISPHIFYDFKLSYTQQKMENYLYEDQLGERYLQPLYIGTGETDFATGGTPGPGKPTDTFTNGNVKFDLYWQANMHHGIKTGFLLTVHEIDRTRIDVRNKYFGADDENLRLEDPISGKIDFPNYDLEIVPITNETMDVYTVHPYEFSGYIQDKMEFDDMVINLGVRYDYFNPDQVYPTDRRNPGNQLNLPDSMMSTYPKAVSQYQISPRFGLAYKLSDQAVLRFSYGHFFQMPPMYAIYQNNVFRVPTNDYGITMGDAQLDAQKAVTYEIGLWQELMEGMGLELALYYKDIYDLLTTKIISTYNQIEYGLYTNKDYGNARGLEVKWKYQISGFYTNINYTLAYTKGNADNPIQTFTRAGNSMDPIKRYIPMSWDQRHTFNITSGYSTKDYGITLTGYYNSGTPYTFEPLGYSELSLINLYVNNDYKPTTVSVDLMAYWDIPIISGYNARIYLNIYNLLDRLNANWVYGDTGKPYETITTEAQKKSHRSDFNDVSDQFKNPSCFSAPRQIKIGIGIQF